MKKPGNGLRGMLGGLLALAIIVPWPAAADYWGLREAPDWRAEPGYSHQSWGFGTPPVWREVDADQDGDRDAYDMKPPGYRADHAMAPTGNGAGFLRTDFGDAFSWDWIDEGPMGQDWPGVQGMIGGMGHGSFDFRIMADAPRGHAREIWIQYVAFIPNGSDGSAMDVQVARDAAFTSSVGVQRHKSWARIPALDKAGSTGDWWRVTELWRIETPADSQFIRLFTSDHGAVNLLDSMDILTRSVGAGLNGAAPVAQKNTFLLNKRH